MNIRYASLCSGIGAASVAREKCRTMPRRAEIQSNREQYGCAGDALDGATD